MIYTFTLNPAIDYHMAFETIELGELNRAHLNRFTVGGKGINVAIILNRLNINVQATGFIGGFTGNYLKEFLKSQYHLETSFIPIEDNTRINVKLSNHQVTELNARAPYVKRDEYGGLKKVITNIKKGDWVVIAGSGIPSQAQAYEDIVRHCVSSGVPFILDVERDELKRLITHRPFLIKPNLYELETYVQRTLTTQEDILTAAQSLMQEGALHVLISLGEQGSYLLTPSQIFHAKPYKIKVRNVVGSGDSMVGAFLATYTKTQDVLESYKWAVAAGTATAMSHELASDEDIEALSHKIEIVEVTT